QPLFTLPLSVLWLHEPLTLPIIASSALIALGVYISEKH
ncbi:EamA/RhaT family transporter, partial [Candidatus Collierbacteria bacterium]|nr:EamA/RhaT family transporter [Candidatus Collierbacteria bacterium]